MNRKVSARLTRVWPVLSEWEGVLRGAGGVVCLNPCVYIGPLSGSTDFSLRIWKLSHSQSKAQGKLYSCGVGRILVVSI